jgi:hypothetical protein
MRWTIPTRLWLIGGLLCLTAGVVSRFALEAAGGYPEAGPAVAQLQMLWYTAAAVALFVWMIRSSTAGSFRRTMAVLVWLALVAMIALLFLTSGRP